MKMQASQKPWPDHTIFYVQLFLCVIIYFILVTNNIALRYNIISKIC